MRPSSNEISRAVQSVATLYSRVFIFIDALDECQKSDDHRAAFLSEIFDFQAKCKENIFATSRFIPEIMENFQGSLSLAIRASEHNVRRYVDGRISHLPSFIRRNADLQDEVKTEIVNAADGIYVAFIFSSLESANK